MFEMNVESSLEDCECCGMYELINVECNFDGIKKEFGTNSHLGGGNLSTTDPTSQDFFIDIIKAYSTHLKEKYNIDVTNIDYNVIGLENGSIIEIIYDDRKLSYVYALNNTDYGYDEYVEGNIDYFKAFLEKENIQYKIEGIYDEL